MSNSLDIRCLGADRWIFEAFPFLQCLDTACYTEKNGINKRCLMSIIQTIKEQVNMTERERDICRYILENPEKIEEMSSRELGHATFTSAASVTRFCQKIGVKGFPEFKMQFVQELRTGGMEEHSAVTMSERENVVTMVRKAEQIQKLAVEETNKELSYTQLVRIGKLIADAKSVDFYVYDMNNYLAKYGSALFFTQENCQVFTLKLIYKDFMRRCRRMDMSLSLSAIRGGMSVWRRLKKCCTEAERRSL